VSSGWIQEISQLTQKRQDHVIVTLTQVKGSAPQIVGSKMIVSHQGLVWGTVGGGKLEAHCLSHAHTLLMDSRSSAAKTLNLQRDLNMTCGGEVSLFFDCNYFADWTVAVFGAGHVSQELCRVMSTWSCHIKVFDTRKEWLAKLPSSENIDASLCSDLSAEVDKLPKDTFLICMTQGHATDLPILIRALKISDRFAFVGAIGSEQKARRLRQELHNSDLSDDQIKQLHCPLGLAIGNNTPPEISISIAAQILATKRKTND